MNFKSVNEKIMQETGHFIDLLNNKTLLNKDLFETDIQKSCFKISIRSNLSAIIICEYVNLLNTNTNNTRSFLEENMINFCQNIFAKCKVVTKKDIN